MAMGEGRYKIRHQQGSVLVEAVIALPVFFFILFGIIEYSYAYRTKATLNMATFEAVRAGTLHNARLGAIESALAKGMAPQYMKGNADLTSFQQALLRANAFAALIKAAPGSPDAVDIVAPTNSTFSKFRERVNVQLVGDSAPQSRFVIPNDNLYWRNPVLETVTIDGTQRKVTIQDANILKIKTLWCHRLITPGLDQLVYRTILNFGTISAEQRVCNNLTLGGGRNYYVAVTSQSVMRMQSPVFSEGQLP